MRKFRTYGEVDHGTGSGLLEQVLDQRARLARRLSRIGAIVAIVSGKGGVGKSAVTAHLAATLAGRGHGVGVVDADLNGPSVARMLGVRGQRLREGENGVAPAVNEGGVRVISMELLQDAEDAPLRWKEPDSDTFLWQSSMETTALREFLGDVDWGPADFLLVDVPPGTDKIRRLLELVPDLSAVLVVTTPSEMSRSVVARSIRLVREAEVPNVALVANMTGYLCPDCGSQHALFPGNGAMRLAEESGLPVWAELPFDPQLGEATDRGRLGPRHDLAAPIARTLSSLADHLEGCLRGASAKDMHRAASTPTEDPGGAR